MVYPSFFFGTGFSFQSSVIYMWPVCHPESLKLAYLDQMCDFGFDKDIILTTVPRCSTVQPW